MLIVPLWQFDMDWLKCHYHQQKKYRSFQSPSKVRHRQVRFALLRHFRQVTIPPPVLLLYDEFERRTAPPAMEQPINKKENRHIKNLFIFFIFTSSLLSYYTIKISSIYVKMFIQNLVYQKKFINKTI